MHGEVLRSLGEAGNDRSGKLMLDRPAGTIGLPSRGFGPSGNDSLSGAAFLSAVAALRRRCWWLIATLVLVPALAFVAVKQTTPRYTATGTLLYEPSEYKVRELQSILRADPTTDAVMTSQAEVVRGLHVIERVVERGNLDRNPEFNAALRPPPFWKRLLGQSPAEEIERESVYGPWPDEQRGPILHAVQSAFDVKPLKFSRVLQVSFSAQDPLVAAAAVNNAMDIYVKDQYAAKHRAVEQATALLHQRENELREQVQEGEKRLATKRASVGFAQGMHAGADAEQISHLTEEAVRARGDLANAESRLNAARGLSGAEAQAAIAPSVVQLRAQQDQLELQLQAQRERLGGQHPDMTSLQRQLAEIKRAIATEIAHVVAASEADVRAARERVAALDKALKDAEQFANQQAVEQAPLAVMDRALEASRQELQSVLERITQTARQAEVESPEAHEISQALPPLQPSSPRIIPVMAGAVAAGLLLGLTLVYLVEQADTTLQSGPEVQQALGVTCLALVPDVARRRGRGAVMLDDYVLRRSASLFAEQIRALALVAKRAADCPKVLGVTSPLRGEGKTTVALALARLLTSQGERVLLVECDLRTPSIGERLHAVPGPGLAECLRGAAEAESVIRRDPASGVDVILAGQRGGADLPGLIRPGALERLIAPVAHNYDLVILDAPPVLGAAETGVIAQAADTTLLCLRWRATPRAVASYALESLDAAHVRLLGSVLTRVDARAYARSGFADAGVCASRRRRLGNA